MIKIFDNYLSEENFKKIFEKINSNFFPFYYCENIVKNSDDPYQFYHRLIGIENNEYIVSNEINSFYPFFESIKKDFNVNFFLRATINFLTPHPEFEKEHHEPHIDIVDTPHFVLLYYLNDSDGDTFFFEKNRIVKRIKPKKNRLIYFDGSILHASSSPKKNNKRLVINLDIQK